MMLSQLDGGAYEMTTLFKVGFGFLLGFLVALYGLGETPVSDARSWKFVAYECMDVVERQGAVITNYLAPRKDITKLTGASARFAGQGGEDVTTKKHGRNN